MAIYMRMDDVCRSSLGLLFQSTKGQVLAVLEATKVKNVDAWSGANESKFG
jgi:hypothetical protein